MARKKRHSKRSSRRGVRRNRGHRRLRRNPSGLQWLLLAGGGYLAYRWWRGHAGMTVSVPALPSAPPPVVAQAVPPPAVSGLGSLVVM